MSDLCGLFLEILDNQTNVKADHLRTQIDELRNGTIPIATLYTPLGNETITELEHGYDILMTKPYICGLCRFGDSLTHLKHTPKNVNGDTVVHEHLVPPCERLGHGLLRVGRVGVVAPRVLPAEPVG